MARNHGSTTDVTVDLAHVGNAPKRRLHGVNNGPVGYGSLIDVSHHVKDLGVPYVRLHDPDWPHPRAVDVPQLFPDFEADPDDPVSYDFLRTDEYVRNVVATGADIIYRLGVSIEHTAVKTYTHPPADLERWAPSAKAPLHVRRMRAAHGFPSPIGSRPTSGPGTRLSPRISARARALPSSRSPVRTCS